MDSYLPALPALGRDLGSGPSVIQLTLTACLTGLALGQLITRPASDRHGRRRPLLIGAAGYAVTSLLCTVAPSATLLIFARLMQGAAGSRCGRGGAAHPRLGRGVTPPAPGSRRPARAAPPSPSNFRRTLFPPPRS